MEIRDIADAIRWQANHAEEAGAPATTRVIRAQLAMIENEETATARRLANWHGPAVQDAVPLRIAGGLHHLLLSDTDRALEPVYAGLTTDQGTVDEIVCDLAATYDNLLLPWLDTPPQTNEAGRAASIMAGLAWLTERLGKRFRLYELGASAGINTMMDRFRYDLGGVQYGAPGSPVVVEPEWRGDAPPSGDVEIDSVFGCDLKPIDLTDPEQALRLKAYVWPEATERMARIDAAIRLAKEQPPLVARQSAGQFVTELLTEEQDSGVCRTLFHSIVWQYLSDYEQGVITEALEEAGRSATREKPLAWVRLETNRETFRHELTVRYWDGEAGDGSPHLLAEAHPHGAWVNWLQ
ncbi:DUF2332 domain-containing protein [Altererythrobacter sp. HHU K3-1]|uniref:DUF2332 domain-containing protein n=2 Tax=Qipengyuania atrilutea TaxID=2744473 RepID=A0A850H106_9SPHN|nr:DUF2332 domain-containing protein [Actirhodobacter atriluteus]